MAAAGMGEYDLMGEERDPLRGGLAVGVGSADKLMLAVGMTDQFGGAETADNLAARPLNKEMI